MFYFFFFFKQKTAYEISACLVGSEMCIRDRCWPRAGPTGGDGLALPAVICSFTIAWTFFAMLEPLHLVVLKLHGRQPPEDGHHDLQLAPLRIQVVDRALEVHERPFDHAHLVPLLEGRLELRLLRALLHLTQDALDLLGRQRHRLGPRAHETGRNLVCRLLLE